MGSLFRQALLAWFSLFYVALFATPLSVAWHNQGGLALSLPHLALGLGFASALLSVFGARLCLYFSTTGQRSTVAVLTSMAFLLAWQANVVHTLSDFGSFTGEILLFRQYGHWFWIEWLGFLTLLLTLVLVAWRYPRAPRWLACISVASCTLVLLQSWWQAGSAPSEESGFDEEVFTWSEQANLVHLLPDALQTDTVLGVLKDHPELAAAFDGFTLFSDNLGPYHGTAPALPALLTGQPFDFSKGHIYTWIGPFIEQHAYPNRLVDSGWRTDMVPIHEVYCIERADSCVPRPFNDWKSRGYERHVGGGPGYELAVLADLSLYRMTPAYLKEKIHNEGRWLLAGVTADGASPWPDPVVREWTARMQVQGSRPRYRFYHYLGTHKPTFWSADCARGAADWQQAGFEAQAYCVLSGVAAFLEALKLNGIYDQTAIVITGDHGHGSVPGELIHADDLPGLSAEMIGTARPALLVKPMNTRGDWRSSDYPSSLLDLPRLIERMAAGADFPGMTEYRNDQTRYFYRYSLEGVRRWAEQPIAYEAYSVNGPTLDGRSWRLADMKPQGQAPSAYPDMNYATTGEFVQGADIRTGDGDQKEAWLRQKQLSFVLSTGPGMDGGTTLAVKLHLPDWIPTQEVSLAINGTNTNDVLQISNSDRFWSQVEFRVPQGLLREGNNFFQLQFSRLVNQPGAEHHSAAALIGSIHWSESRL